MSFKENKTPNMSLGKNHSIEYTDHDESEILLGDPEGRSGYVLNGRHRLLNGLGLFFLATNSLWSILLVYATAHGLLYRVGPDLIHSPARSAITYETVTTNSTVYNTNEFRGRPSKKVTKTWYEAYTKLAHIVVQKEDLDAIGKQSIELSDGSGYLATLEVFHQLHCLDRIREYIFSDYYQSGESPQRSFEHMDHCLDTVRLALMCHGDISLVTFEWQADELLPAANFHTVHECRSWDHIVGWTKARQADMSLLIRPQ